MSRGRQKGGMCAKSPMGRPGLDCEDQVSLRPGRRVAGEASMRSFNRGQRLTSRRFRLPSLDAGAAASCEGCARGGVSGAEPAAAAAAAATRQGGIVLLTHHPKPAHNSLSFMRCWPATASQFHLPGAQRGRRQTQLRKGALPHTQSSPQANVCPTLLSSSAWGWSGEAPQALLLCPTTSYANGGAVII